MAGPQLSTREQADRLYQMLQSGQVAPDKQQEAITALRQFMEAEKQSIARQRQAEALNSLIDTSPRPGAEPPVYVRDKFSILRGEGVPSSGTPENPTREYFLNEAAKKGLDVHTGLPVTDRGKTALLSFDGEVQQAALEYLVRTNLRQSGIRLPQGVPVIFQDETSAEAYYLRPENGKLVRTLINPAGIDAGDIIELGPEALSFGMEVGGAIGGGTAGSAVGGPGAGTAVGGAVGAAGGLFASYEVRQAAAKMFGIPSEIADNADIPFFDIAFAAGGELGGAAIMGTIRAVRNAGRPLSAEDLPRLQAKYEENLAKVRALEERLGGDVKLSPSVGELTGDPRLFIIEHELRREAKGGAAVEAQARDIELRRNMGQAFRELADANSVRTPMDLDPIEEVSRDVQSRARTAIEAVEQQKAAVREQIDDTNEYFDTAPDLQLFRDVRDGTARAADEAKQTSDRAWNVYREEVGFDPVTRQSQYKLSNPGDSPIRQYMNTVEGDRQAALMESLARSQEAFLRDAGFGPDTVQRVMSGEEPPSLLAKPTLDMRHLHFVLSHLKRQLRQSGMATEPDARRAEDVRGLVQAIEAQIKDTPIVHKSGRTVSREKQDRIRLVWDDANSATRNMHEQFDTLNMQKMLETRRVRVESDAPATTRPLSEVLGMADPNVPLSRLRQEERRYLDNLKEQIQRDGLRNPIVIRVGENGRPMIDDGMHRLAVLQELGYKDVPVRFTGPGAPKISRWEDELSMNPLAVRAAMFKAADTRFMQEALEAVGHNPATKAALARQLMLQYRDQVFKDGVPQQARHNDFVTNFQDHMNILLGPEDAARINDAGDFARQVRQYEDQVRKLETDVRRAYGRRVADPLNSINISKEVLSDRMSPKQVQNLMNALERFDTELADQVRGHVLEQAFFKATGKNDLINSRTLTSLIRDNAATFDVLFGRSYRQDLERLRDVVKMIDQRSLARPPGMEVQTWWLQLTRSVMGPLSRKQRFLTAANRLARRVAGKKAAEIMASPDKLDSFIRLSKMGPRDPRFLGLVTALGLVEAIDEDTMSTARRAAELQRKLPDGTRGIMY